MTTTDGLLKAQVSSIVEVLDNIDSGMYVVDPNYHEDGTTPAEAWLDEQLSLEYTGKRTLFGNWEITGAVITVTTGGPHIEVRWTFSNVFVVEGWWGSQHVVQRVECDDLHDLLVARADSL